MGIGNMKLIFNPFHHCRFISNMPKAEYRLFGSVFINLFPVIIFGKLFPTRLSIPALVCRKQGTLKIVILLLLQVRLVKGRKKFRDRIEEIAKAIEDGPHFKYV